MKPTRFRALRAVCSPALVAAGALALLALTPACKKSTEAKTPTTAAERAALALELQVSSTLAGTSKVSIAGPVAAPAPATEVAAVPAADPASAGVKKETATHTVEVHVPASTASGVAGVVKVTLVPKPGWKINEDFPISLKVSAPAGVTVDKPKLRKGDAASFGKQRAEFHVKFKATAAGAKQFTAKFKFAMCTDETCDPKREELAWNVNVK